jgi:hypothetical protein
MNDGLVLCEILDRCSAAGVEISEHQLERWRGEELLPPVQQVHVRGRRGSQTLYPSATVGQAITIARLLSTRRSLETVGWWLWFEGYEVGERHWKPRLHRMATWLESVLNQLFRLMERDGGATAAERYGRRIVSKLPVAGSARRMKDRDVFEALDTLMMMICGEFAPYNADTIDGNKNERFDALRKLLGFKRGEDHAVDGNKLNYEAAIENAFQAIAESKLYAAGFADCGDDELIASRDMTRDALRVASHLYNTSKSRLGSGAFGLRIAQWFVNRAPPDVQAAIILFWACVTKDGDRFFSVSEVSTWRALFEKVQFNQSTDTI